MRYVGGTRWENVGGGFVFTFSLHRILELHKSVISKQQRERLSTKNRFQHYSGKCDRGLASIDKDGDGPL